MLIKAIRVKNSLRVFFRLFSSDTCRIIDGKAIANNFKRQLKSDIEEWIGKGNRPPQLTAVLVGDDPASQSYVNIKLKAAKKVGINADAIRLPFSADEGTILKTIYDLNINPNVDGILVQLPVPKHVRERVICNAVLPGKDVDGFSVYNVGRLALNMECVVPCTALAVVHLIASTGISTQGKNAVVCGRSKNVGLPIALLLHSQKSGDLKGLGMTTAICHRYTPPEDLRQLTLNADVIVSAAGVPHLIKGDMIKDGACLIDVGMTRVQREDKVSFVGDVDFEGVVKKAGHLTPVPGGVGPMTVAMLLKNTLKAAAANPVSQPFNQVWTEKSQY